MCMRFLLLVCRLMRNLWMQPALWTKGAHDLSLRQTTWPWLSGTSCTKRMVWLSGRVSFKLWTVWESRFNGDSYLFVDKYSKHLYSISPTSLGDIGHFLTDRTHQDPQCYMKGECQWLYNVKGDRDCNWLCDTKWKGNLNLCNKRKQVL